MVSMMIIMMMRIMTITMILIVMLVINRSTRTPAFWGYLPPPHDYAHNWVKRRQSQSYKFKEFAKISKFWHLKQLLHATHLLKLPDKMCKYEMDPMRIVEDTERTRFCPQTDRLTDGQRTRWNQYIHPFNFVEARGIIKMLITTTMATTEITWRIKIKTL